jgi:5-methylcytosine-specific restriction endonuclease McrA
MPRKIRKTDRIYPTGEKHHGWLGGQREKSCQQCGKTFAIGSQPITSFKTRKFCSKPCADRGGFRYEGKNHPNWKEETRRKHRRGKHGAWARAVISRDKATCRHCGISGVQLHAHHVKPYDKFPAIRWDLSNGMTLCFRCHLAVHTASNANGVNSVNSLPGHAGANTEPSSERKLIEGVTTSGRVYRRWNGECAFCRKFISKPWSDTKGKTNLFCSKSCSAKFNRKHGISGRRNRRTMVITATKTPPERDEIV